MVFEAAECGEGFQRSTSFLTRASAHSIQQTWTQEFLCPRAGLGLNSRWWTKTRAGEDVEKSESLCIANENIKWGGRFGKGFGSSSKS